MRVAVIGGDAYATSHHVCGALNTIDKESGPITHVIHAGGHVGELAASWAMPRKIEVTACSACEILELLPYLLVVFAGVRDVVQQPKDAGVRVVVVR